MRQFCIRLIVFLLLISMAEWLLAVDTNEQSHYAERKVDRTAYLATQCDMRAETRKMDCGDYGMVLVDKETGVERCVALIERKMAQDMAASIKDTRYQSQAQRMEASGVPSSYWFIIGNVLRSPAEDTPRVESGMVHLSTPVYPNTRVLHLSNDTVDFVNTVRRLAGYLYDFYVLGNTLSDLPLYRAVQEAGAKPRLDTQAVVWVEQLTIPRGMSRTKARAVASVYPSADSLLAAYKRLSAQDPPSNARSKKKRTIGEAMDAMLEDVPLPKGKRLGKACSAMIRRTFLSE